MKEELYMDLIRLVEKYQYSIDWVSPEWEPITKVAMEDRRILMFVLSEILGGICMKNEPSLGVTKVTWSKCSPERAFLIGKKEDLE